MMSHIPNMPEKSGPDAGVCKITVCGAGLVGSLLSIFLARRGFDVQVFEKRADMRHQSVAAGRSVNLAISNRGINALRQVGLDREILKQSVQMKGRMIHSREGKRSFFSYGTAESDCINSISRATLNKVLLTAAEDTGRVHLNFARKVIAMNPRTRTIAVLAEDTGVASDYETEILIGADGSASAMRDAILRVPGWQFSQSILEYGYKELLIPAASGGIFSLERNALHIWPRGNYMLIALPNFEGSFTCTLFLPLDGPVSFAALPSPELLRAFFQEQFPDVLPLLFDLEGTFFGNPTCRMATIKCHPWNLGGQALVIGDAAHGIVPFFGQGMNCGFEDCSVFAQCLDEYGAGGQIDWARLFEDFVCRRKSNTDAIADMAVANFQEMADKVADVQFQKRKAVEKVLEKKFPGRYFSRYALVAFSYVPYRVALEAGEIEERILTELCLGLENPQDVDLQRADRLIDELLSPLLSLYTVELSPCLSH